MAGGGDGGTGSGGGQGGDDFGSGAGSLAASAGFRAGDELVSLGGQPLILIADFSWVLHRAKEAGFLQHDVRVAVNGFATRASEGEMIGRLLLTTKGGRSR